MKPWLIGLLSAIIWNIMAAIILCLIYGDVAIIGSVFMCPIGIGSYAIGLGVAMLYNYFRRNAYKLELIFITIAVGYLFGVSIMQTFGSDILHIVYVSIAISMSVPLIAQYVYMWKIGNRKAKVEQ